MKGVSAVIATILMLMITIGLAAVAASYFFGWFTGQTAVVLSVDDAECNGGYTVWVRNDGTQDSGTVTVAIDNDAAGDCSIASIGSGEVGSCSPTTATSSGYHSIRVTTTGSSSKGSVYCAT